MCGICGALSFSHQDFAVTESYITRMRDTMLHRGPDGGETWIDPDRCVGLGFRRLAIIDLSDLAMQPMCNEDGSLWVIFNGEIYNHGEIRAELERIGGHQWKTDHSDTEMILHAFEEWGINCLQRFRGMFAMALWDAKQQELWLVRDRIGIKPLYYSIHHGRIIFASEIKALLQDPQQIREVNEEALFHYLSFLTTPAPETLFKGIKKLPGGTWLRVKATGEVYEQRYWDVWDNRVSLAALSEDEIAARLLNELRTAVKLRKISDVPVGVFLSGGIDSSTNAALFSEGESGAVKSFSIGYDENYGTYQNELHYARLVSKMVGAEYHEKLLNIDDLINFLPRMVQLQDEPIADPVCVPVYYVSKLARENGVVVCQVGEGADELFWGYPEWKQVLMLQTWNDLAIPNGLRSVALAGIQLIGKRQGVTYERFRRAKMGQPMFWGGAEAFTQLQKESLLSPRLRRKFKGQTSWEAIEPIYQRFENGAQEKSVLNWMSYLDLNMRLPELLLMRIDKMSMGVSLEGRVPFLDHKFVELAMSIPTVIKTRNSTLKYILKKAVRGVIPDEIIDRKKQGFAVPIYEWFFGKLGDQARTTLEEFCDETDYFDKKQIRTLFEQKKTPQLWYLLNFAMWWNEVIAKSSF
jgi:asparagine synthase (glutamine-hydrolysing)